MHMPSFFPTTDLLKMREPYFVCLEDGLGSAERVGKMTCALL